MHGDSPYQMPLIGQVHTYLSYCLIGQNDHIFTSTNHQLKQSKGTLSDEDVIATCTIGISCHHPCGEKFDVEKVSKQGTLPYPAMLSKHAPNTRHRKFNLQLMHTVYGEVQSEADMSGDRTQMEPHDVLQMLQLCYSSVTHKKINQTQMEFNSLRVPVSLRLTR